MSHKNSLEEKVLKQVQQNAAFWGSNMAKRSTVEKYLAEDGCPDPRFVIDELIRRGRLKVPKRGYVQVAAEVFK